VTDDKDRFIEGLTAASFVGKYRGKPVRVLGASRDASSHRIVILLDASGSVIGSKGAWEAEGLLAADIVRSIASYNTFALIVFASEVEDKVDFGQGLAAVANKVGDLSPELDKIAKDQRKTALYDAILAGVAEFGQPRLGDIIYVITDGGDNKSRTTRSEAERALLASGVRLFAFLMVVGGFERGRTPEEEEGSQSLRQLVVRSGGAMGTVIGSNFELPRSLLRQNIEDAVRDAHSLYSVMQESYRIELQLPESVDKPRDWKFEVVDSGGKKDRHLQVMYPRLGPCGTQTKAN